MFELFLPYLIGSVLGIDPNASEPPPMATQTTSEAAAPEAPAEREPEPQIPTGKYTTALEVRPILAVTKGSWIAVRDYDGQDLLYFTNLLAWRCGLWSIHYGINGGAADQAFALEPCHEDLAMPNALTDIAQFLPYLTFSSESIESVTVEITFDDGTTDSADYQRSDIQIP